MIKEYDKCKEQIQELIDIANLEKERLHIITIFDNPYQTDALSGMIYPIEIEDIEAGFYVPPRNIPDTWTINFLKKIYLLRYLLIPILSTAYTIPLNKE